MKTTLEKRIIVAEKRGLQAVRDVDCFIGAPYVVFKKDGKLFGATFDTIDSICEAVLMQSEEFQAKFETHLVTKTWETEERPDRHYHQLTPDDWLDAFVETVEKMK